MFENLGNKLKTLRIQNGLSRKQVADLIGVSASLIGLYETGERLPSLAMLMKLSAHYKVSIDYLLDNKVAGQNSVSLEGLTEKQVAAVRATIECFHNLPSQ